MIEIFFVVILFIHLLLTVIVLINFFSPINLKNSYLNEINLKSKVSILIPARNEEKNISNCIDDIYKQTLTNKEVICYDDNSTDDTYNVLLQLKNKYENFYIIKGSDLPIGWTGKNWACYQLALHSSGEYLIFLDADVRLTDKAIQSALYNLIKYNVQMLSIFPTQIMRSIGEYLIVPSMNWFLLTFLPLIFIRKISNPSVVAANGQFVLFERDAYFKIGGHQSVKNKIVEDLELARLMKKNNFNVVTMLGGKLIFARMYNSLLSSLNGFSKNFFSGFKTKSSIFLFFLLWFFFTFILPFLLLLIDLKFLIIVGVIYLQKFLISYKSNQSILINFLLLPIQLSLVILLGIRSMILTKRGKLIWKGRKV